MTRTVNPDISRNPRIDEDPEKLRALCQARTIEMGEYRLQRDSLLVEVEKQKAELVVVRQLIEQYRRRVATLEKTE